MPKTAMPKRAIGVHLRPGSNVWQWRIKAPKDLRHVYPSAWARRCSLGTSSLAAANTMAARLYADWLATFDQQRKGSKVVERLTPEHGRAIAHEALKILLAEENTRLNQSDRKMMLLPLKVLGVSGMQGFALGLGLSFDDTTLGAQEALAHYLDTIEGPMRAKLAEVPAAPPKPAW